MQAKAYIDTHKGRFLEELLDLLQIPSVSADKAYAKDVFNAAEFVKNSLLKAGINKAEICPTEGYPIVYAECMVSPNLPTVLVYGHYDVQPPDPLDLWHTPAFEPQIRDGKIYARGASDDKGQFYMHIKAFEVLHSIGALPCNVKFMIEGEEEVGSKHLGNFVKENKEKLKADIILISDTSLFSMDCPSITAGLRGLSYVEVEVTGPNRDLHSGVYGGAVANPINALASMIASMHDDNHRITIPGFYDQVVELSRAEREAINAAPFDLEQFKQELGVAEVAGEAGYTTLERTGIRPTLDVNGIWGGYIGEGAKTVLPSKAFAKISMRLVPNQTPDEIIALFRKHFESIAPTGVTVKVNPHHGGDPAVISTDSIAYKAATAAFEEVWGKTPIPTREGGSIPIVALFQKELGLDSLLMGFGLNTDAIHSPNEHYGVENFLKGIETITAFYRHFARLNR